MSKSNSNELTVDQSIGLDSVSTILASVHTVDIAVVPPKLKCYRYVLGDVYRLSLAPNLKIAMRIFGCSDPSRCHLYSPYPKFIYDLFDSPVILTSGYDNSSTILQFNFK